MLVPEIPRLLEAIDTLGAAMVVSVTWMKNWAMQHMSDAGWGDDPLTETEAYNLAIQAGHATSVGSNESARDYIDNTWWDHWETITGCRGERGTYFSCAC
jgi:hypothetical protein